MKRARPPKPENDVAVLRQMLGVLCQRLGGEVEGSADEVDALSGGTLAIEISGVGFKVRVSQPRTILLPGEVIQ